MKTLAVFCFILAAFAVPPIGAQQTKPDLSVESYAALSQQRDALEGRVVAGSATDSMIEEMIAINEELSNRDLALFEADEQQVDAATPALKQATEELVSMAHMKWCHTNPWRWIRHYHEPQWCAWN